MDNAHAVTKFFRFRNDMGGKENCFPAFVELLKQLTHFLKTEGVETAHRFIEDEEFGVMKQRLRQARSLLHAFGKFSQTLLGLIGQADFREDLFDPLAAVQGRKIGQRPIELQEFGHREVFVKRRQFRKIAYALHDVQVRQERIEQADFPTRREKQA